MACLTEFQCAVYADGELPARESREMDEHLKTCASCSELVAALRAESRVLVECFQVTDFIEFELEDESLSAPQAHSLGVVKFTAFVLAMSVLLRPVLDVLEELGLPGRINWLPIAVAHIIPAGITVVDSVWNHAHWIALSAVVFLVFLLFSRRSVLTNSILSALALLTVFSSTSYGLDVRPSGQPVTVPPGETVDDTLIVAADSVTIDGTVTGDLIALVRQVTIRGTVKGNLVSFARSVELEGTVEGSIIGFAQSITTRGEVARNIYAFGETVDIGRGSKIGENATMFASESHIEGAIGKDAYAMARSINVSDPARIGGGLTARVSRSEDVRIAGGATINGKTNIRTDQPRPSKYATLSFYIWQTIRLAAAVLTGLVLFWFFPELSRVRFATTRELLTSAAVGFLTLVAIPVAAVIAAITLIGLPVGLIAFACWLTAIYAAKIVVAGFLGRSMLQNNAALQPATALAVLAGLVPIFVAINLPYIGPLVNFLLIVLGLGAIANGAYQMPRWRSAQLA